MNFKNSIYKQNFSIWFIWCILISLGVFAFYLLVFSLRNDLGVYTSMRIAEYGSILYVFHFLTLVFFAFMGYKKSKLFKVFVLELVLMILSVSANIFLLKNTLQSFNIL